MLRATTTTTTTTTTSTSTSTSTTTTTSTFRTGSRAGATPSGNWRPLGDHDGQSWAYAKVTLAPGAHVLIADQNVGIDVYGYDKNVSYAYAGGSAVDRISEAPPIP